MQCPDTCEEFRKRKWFYQIIISSGVKASDPVIHRSARSEDEYRYPETTAAHFTQRFEPALSRQHDIKENEIKRGIAQFLRNLLEPPRTRFLRGPPRWRWRVSARPR